MDNELLLFDRLEVIRTTIQQYGEENFYISFSGGKDSTVVHYLVDMAIPGNKIPRVFGNTGIEYQAIVNFVKELQKTDDRIVMITPAVPIKKVLEEKGYPFKSKEHSEAYSRYRKHKEIIDPYIQYFIQHPEELNNFDTVHNLPINVKSVVKYFFGKREREREIYISTKGVPNILKYQYLTDINLNISDECCVELKEKPLKKWAKENHKKHTILGLMAEEGGRRENSKCKVLKDDKLSFHPLIKVSKEWEEWFIQKYNIQLCDLYYPPFNFKRTGCKGCPFSLDLQEQLSVMDQYMPAERKQCEYIWKPVYEEYRRIGYRLKKEEQIKLL